MPDIFIDHPLTDGKVQPVYDAFGTYVLSAFAPPARGVFTITAKMTKGGFTKDGVVSTPASGEWVAHFDGLPVDVGYTIIVKITQDSLAPVLKQETNIEVSLAAAVIHPPIHENFVRPNAVQSSTAVAGGAAVAALGHHRAPIIWPGSYPLNLHIEKIVCVVHDRINEHKYASVNEATLLGGKFAVIFPTPHDYVHGKYIAEFLMLNKLGVVVLASRASF